MHALAVRVAQHAAHERERAGSADDIDAGDVGGQCMTVAGLGPSPAEARCAWPIGYGRRAARKHRRSRPLRPKLRALKRRRRASCKIDGDFARRRVEALFDLATLLDEELARALRERGALDLCLREHQIGEHGVEVVSAEPVDPGGGDDLVQRARHAQRAKRRTFLRRCRRRRRDPSSTSACCDSGGCTRSRRPRAR